MVCRTCGRRIDPADTSLVYGFEQVDVPGMGQSHDFIDGIPAYFHPECFPGSPRYRRASRP